MNSLIVPSKFLTRFKIYFALKNAFANIHKVIKVIRNCVLLHSFNNCNNNGFMKSVAFLNRWSMFFKICNENFMME